MLVSYEKLVVPKEKRLYIVGDLHGGFDLYEKGIKDLGIKDNDVVISLSDLIDRGPKNFACVAEFYKNPNRKAILGNHEDLIIKGLIHNSRSHFHTWWANGGDVTWAESGGAGSMLLASMVSDFPVILDIEYGDKRLGFVHGGIPGGQLSFDKIIQMAKSDPKYQEQLIWDRSIIDDYKKRGNVAAQISDVDYVFHGHTPVQKPTILGNRVYMDTGGVFNNKLTFAYFYGGNLTFYTTGDHDNL